MNAKERARGASVVALCTMLVCGLALSACGYKRVHQDLAPAFSPCFYDPFPWGCYSIDSADPVSKPDR